MKEHLVESSSRAAAASTTMTDQQLCAIADEEGDTTADGRGRLTYSFDGYGLLRMANRIRAQALEEAAVICEQLKREFGDYDDCVSAIRSIK